MTKIEIIKETAEFYNSSNRGFAEELQNCEYLTSTGLKCAVGRCVKDDSLGIFAMDWCDSSVISMNSAELNTALKPEYQGHDVKFWQDIQNFHDASYNWNDTGLTDQGRVEYNALLNKYKDQ